MRSYRCWTTAVAVLCLAGIAQAAATTAPSKGDLSSPKAAARSFVEALIEGDVAAAQAATIATPRQRQGLELLASMAGSLKSMTDAAIAHFGEPGADITDQRARIKQNFKVIEDSNVKIDGDTATLSGPEGTKPVTLRNQDGKWKVDLASIPGLEELPRSEAAIQARTKAALDTADEIKAGKYKTVDEARQAFEKKMLATMIANTPTTRP